MTTRPTPRADERTVRIGGAPVRVADDQPTFWDRVDAGTWEPGSLAALRPHLGTGITFLDMGAWVGPLTLFAAALGSPVLAVEADPAALGQLRRNLDANPDLARLVTTVPRAIAPEAGTVRMGARRKPGDSMSSALLAGTSATAWDAEAITPAELADLAGAAPLLVKLDIEGGEYRLLPQLVPILVRASAALVSFHPGVLAESGERDTEGVTRAALEGLAGWVSYAVRDGGAVRQDLDARELARPPYSRYPDTWLFLPECSGPDLLSRGNAKAHSTFGTAPARPVVRRALQTDVAAPG